MARRNAEYEHKATALPRFFTLEMLMFTIAVLSGLVLLLTIASPQNNIATMVGAGIAFTISLAVVIRLIMDPDNIRARQSDAMLILSRQTLACMQDGLNEKAAQSVCRLLLPSTAAISVAITDRERIIGYAGVEEDKNPIGGSVRTQATHATLSDGKMRILMTQEDIGFPTESKLVRAAIIVPLTKGRTVEGTVKFYYRRPEHISETQKSIAEGFGKLLSTQMAAIGLEQQTQLATRMELKALQSQINPHFMFNTINTIASFIRTNPEKARTLLREFAVFYRRTLEDSKDLILVSREVEQTMRYFSFEVARFGEDRVALEVDIEPAVNDMTIPAFIIQPFVENAVRHAMPSEGKLQICISGKIIDDDVVISIIDNGVGMSDEELAHILMPQSSKGLGIAVKNVNDRIINYFAPGTLMDFQSSRGKGTKVELVLKEAATQKYQELEYE